VRIGGLIRRIFRQNPGPPAAEQAG
jgi:hypothetical protein